MSPACRQALIGAPCSTPNTGHGAACISTASQEIPFHTNIISFYGLPFTHLKWL